MKIITVKVHKKIERKGSYGEIQKILVKKEDSKSVIKIFLTGSIKEGNTICIPERIFKER